MRYSTDEAYWRELEANAHLPEVQEIIREEILSGTIRVRPKLGGGIHIVLVGVPENRALREKAPLPAPIQGDGASPLTAVIRKRRLARCQQPIHANGSITVGLS